jgi:hypothetical protein
MKKLTLLLMIAGLGIVWAQTGEEDYFTSENDNHSSDPTATELINSEPAIISAIISSSNPEVQQASGSTPEMDMTASVEASISEFSKLINIPLWYRWKEFSFNASIPYFISKDQPNFGETLSTSGFGDISIGAGYGKYFEQYNLYSDINLSVKLPTGDEENTEKDQYGNDYTIPLGSGTTDVSVVLSGYYFMDAFTYKGSLLYKMNGEYDYDTSVWDPDLGQYVDATATADIGDLFIFSAGADFRWDYNLTFGLNMVYGNKFATESDGVSNKNGMQYLDLMPSVKYPISLFEFVLGAKIPVYTGIEDDLGGMNDGKRSMSVSFRTNYRIF